MHLAHPHTLLESGLGAGTSNGVNIDTADRTESIYPTSSSTQISFLLPGSYSEARFTNAMERQKNLISRGGFAVHSDRIGESNFFFLKKLTKRNEAAIDHREFDRIRDGYQGCTRRAKTMFLFSRLFFAMGC